MHSGNTEYFKRKFPRFRHKGLNTLDGFADASEAQCSLIQNLASLPATIQRYHATQNEVKEQEQDQKDQAFAGEDPAMLLQVYSHCFHEYIKMLPQKYIQNEAMVNYESLEPTSGRKLWKLRHHKSIKKKLKPHKNGFIGH